MSIIVKESGLLRIVENEPQYYEFIRELRNDERVKEGFIQQGNITPVQQIEYMKTHEKEYWVCLIAGKPCGFVGVIEGDIRVATHPDFQKKGIASFMIEFIKEKFGNKAFAKVKINNEASKSLFLKAGFKEAFIIYTVD